MVLKLITMGAQALSRNSMAGYTYRFCGTHCRKLKYFSFRGYFGIVIWQEFKGTKQL